MGACIEWLIKPRTARGVHARACLAVGAVLLAFLVVMALWLEVVTQT